MKDLLQEKKKLKTTAQIAHLIFADTQANAEKLLKSHFFKIKISGIFGNIIEGVL